MPLFRSSRNPAPQLCCFGKVPGYGDYLSLNADSEKSRAFVAWLQAGASRLASAQMIDPEQSLRFVWRGDGARRLVLGVLWPSSDAAGRRFPLALFTVQPRSGVDALGPRRLLAAEPFWATFEELRSRILDVDRLDALRRVVRDAALPELPDAPSVNRTYVGRVAPTGADTWSVVPLGLHLKDVVHYAESLRGATGLPEFVARLRLHSRIDPTAEAVTWLHVLTENLGVDDLDAALFLRARGPGDTELVVVHRDVQPADLALLLAPREGQRTVDEIGFRDVAVGADDVAFLESFQRKWSVGSRSLSSILEIGAQGWTPGALPDDEPLAVVHPELDDDREHGTADDTQPTPIDDTRPDVDEEITGEIVMSPPTDPITGPLVADTVEEETLCGVAAPDELVTLRAQSVDAQPAGAQPANAQSGVDVAALERRVRELASSPLLPGRLVRVNLPPREHEDGGEVLVYMDDSGAAATHSSATAALDQVRRRIAGHEEARALLSRIVYAHRDLEAELERLVDAACARTRRPGASRPRVRRDPVTIEGR